MWINAEEWGVTKRKAEYWDQMGKILKEKNKRKNNQ